MTTKRKTARPTDELHAALAALGSAYATGAILEESCHSMDSSACARSLWAMHKAGTVLRRSAENGRFEYTLNPDKDTRRKSNQAHAVSHPTPPTLNAPLPTVAAGSGYNLFSHVSHALSDLDDLVGDVIDHDAPKDVLKAVVAAQVCLRRAQSALLGAQAAR